MKITDFENEKAIDVLADLLDPFSIILEDEQFKAFRKTKPSRIKVAQMLLRTHKPEMIQILAILDDTPVEQYNTNLAKLLIDVLNLLGDPTIQDLFTSQGQESIETSSGSAMGNIEDGAQ